MIRYVHRTNRDNGADESKQEIETKLVDSYKVYERLLAFVDCFKKTEEAIYDLIKTTLKQYNIPLSDCRGQGYDNGSNMRGAYKGIRVCRREF